MSRTHVTSRTMLDDKNKYSSRNKPIAKKPLIFVGTIFLFVVTCFWQFGVGWGYVAALTAIILFLAVVAFRRRHESKT